MNPTPSEPTDSAPTSVRVIRELGHGRAATARLVEASFDDGSRVRCVEKVFSPGWLTKTIYRVAFFAPFAYQFNRDAVIACFYRRRVAANVLRRAGLDVAVAEPLYVRFDADAPGWVLAAEFVDGRGVRPACPGESESEMQQLIGVMREAKKALMDAGLTGSGWQIDPRAMVSTANLLRCGGRYTIVDLESGIPALLVPKYVALAASQGSLVPFDDLDASRVASLGIGSDADALIKFTSAWKSAEPAPLRLGTWTQVLSKIRQRIRRSTRGLVHLFTQRRYQTFVGKRYLRRSIRRWKNEQRIAPERAAFLSGQVSDQEITAYARGMALHLVLKPLTPLIVPAKVGGFAAALATGSMWFLLPWLILPMARVMITYFNWLQADRRVRHAEAFLVSCLPLLGSLAFPIQMFASRPELASFLLRDLASKLGRKLPVYGGKDSRTELFMISLADRLIVLLSAMLHRQRDSVEACEVTWDESIRIHGQALEREL